MRICKGLRLSAIWRYPSKSIPEGLIEKLNPFIPAGALPFVEELLSPHAYRLKVVKPRKTKLGDFRPGLRGQPHQITVNGDLPPPHFLLTLIHEIAHLKTHVQFGTKVNPHGREWQQNFQQCMLPVLDSGIYDKTVESEIRRYLIKPKASCSADTRLLRVLKNDQLSPPNMTHLEDIPTNSLFQLPGRRPMKKGKKRRTRFLCEELGTQRTFAVHPLAEVKLLNTKDERDILES